MELKKLSKVNVITKRRILLAVFDAITIIVSSLLALLVRFDFNINNVPPEILNAVIVYMLPNIIIGLSVFYTMRLYHSLWLYAGYIEGMRIIISSVIVSVIQVAAMSLLSLPASRGYFVLFFICLVSLLAAGRYFYRMIRLKRSGSPQLKAKKNIMIIGAGTAASLLVREFERGNRLEGQIRCLIDDNPSKKGMYINSYKVVGGRDKIIESAEKYNIDEIIITIPSANQKQIREIFDICKKTNCELKICPGLYQLINGELSVSKIRKVEIEDLLGREPVSTSLEEVMGYVKGKTVLVTGGGGSIGSELCRQIAQYRPEKLIIVDIYENNAYNIQQELKRKYPELNLVVLIASVRSFSRMQYIFEKYRPQIVYHAAAHKHVPLMESSPNESIKNNVFGTVNTARAANMYGAEKFVLISTDKAVNPTNIMGASKRICEMVIQSFAKTSKTEFAAVRFGNVLGSNGSVIPLFKQQIAEGGPVTVTHPDIIRYFMTIPEAVSLVLQAGAYAKGGEIFVLDMGEPVKILDLAKNLIELSGFRPGVDIDIQFTGLRPGEKLYEELLMSEENLRKTVNKKIFISQPMEIDSEKFKAQLLKLYTECYNEENTESMRELVKEIVPTYTPQI